MMPYPHIVAVGGLGGSGTRVVARMLQMLDIYIGDSLNSKLDNLWFTLLFKRPAWFRAMPEPDELLFTLNFFRRAMEEGLADNLPTGEEAWLHAIMREVEQSSVFLGVTPAVLEEIVRSRRYDRQRFRGWGWKEPNTHVFLPQVVAAIPNLKYVHVIRSGLDMAFSKNQQQRTNWGAVLGYADVQGVPLTPGVALDFWIAANRRAVDIGRVIGPNRFYLLNYDRLCASPAEEIRRLLDFLDVSAPGADPEELGKLVAPVSIGRFRSHPDHGFSAAQIQAVRDLGFSEIFD